MSDKLSPDQITKVQAWIGQKRKVTPCPSCGQNNFTLSEHLVSPPLFSEGGMTIGGPAYPHFMLTCANCGFTQFYNAVIAGIIK